MKDRSLVVDVIDVLTIMCCLLLIAILSIVYDQDKGTDDNDFMEIVSLDVSRDIEGDIKSFSFFAVILGAGEIKVKRYDRGVVADVNNYTSVDDFTRSTYLDREENYVISEEGDSPFFAAITRHFLSSGVPVGVAKVH